LQETFGINSELVAGEKGIFDVMVDGKTIYSRHQTGRFPNEGEVSQILKKNS